MRKPTTKPKTKPYPKKKVTVNGLKQNKGGGYKLTLSDARRAKQAMTRKRGALGPTAVAKIYGISRSMARNIKAGVSWAEA
jgi:hypothetical protein